MSRFHFVQSEPQFDSFSKEAFAAEELLDSDTAASALNSRMAVENAVKWMYSADDSLVMPYDGKLVSLLNTEEFRRKIDEDIHKRIEFILKVGNLVTRNPRKIKKEQAEHCLENLDIFLNMSLEVMANATRKQSKLPKLTP
jgi:type I restriction enzyme R subunit